MNYTKNHHLPQWVKSDRIRMDDFNDAMANIEAGLNAAGSSAVAQDALSKAEAAQAAANNAYSPSNKPYVVGSYTGTTKDLVVRLLFRPSFLIISGMLPSRDGAPNDFSQFDRYFVMVSGFQMNDRVQPHDAGFTVYTRPANGAHYPDLNEPGRKYDYIAFK